MGSKIDKHELVAALKQMAIDEGRTPKMQHFCDAVRGGHYAVRKHFGTYSILVQAAGLEPNRPNSDKRPHLTNAIFEKDIEEVLQNHIPRPVGSPITYETQLSIPDTHFPFHSQRVLEEIYKFNQKYRPKYVFQVGDLYDLYAHSKFPRSLNLYKPEEEEALARKGAEEMWKILKNDNPDAKFIQLKGNHDIRPVRRTLEHLPTLEHVVEMHLNNLMTFEGVELVTDAREEYAVGNVLYHHGYRTKLGDHRDYVLKNMVVGHTHKGGVTYRRIRDEVLWELNCGFAGDPESKVFGYRPQKIHDCTPGFGFIDEYGPRFIPVQG